MSTYRKVSVTIDWLSTKASAEDLLRDHEQDATHFESDIERALSVAVQRIGSPKLPREVTFTARAPIAESDWAAALAAAARECKVLADSAKWDFSN